MENIPNYITSIAYHDPSFRDGNFDEAIAYVKAHDLPDLWQPYDGGELRKDKASWDREYWAYITASLLDNFCEERIAHLKEVGRYVYPIEAKATENTPQSSQQTITTGAQVTGARTTGTRSSYARRAPNQSDISPATLLIGGAAVFILGCATIGVTKTLVATAAVAGGAALLSKQKRRR